MCEYALFCVRFVFRMFFIRTVSSLHESWFSEDSPIRSRHILINVRRSLSVSSQLEPYWGVLSFAVVLECLTYCSPFFSPQAAHLQTYPEQDGPNVRELPVYGIHFKRVRSGGGSRTGLCVDLLNSHNNSIH